MKTIVLGLGNDLLGDDAIGIYAVRKLKAVINGQADVIASSVTGLAIMDFLIGYDQAIIIDAIQTGKHLPGTILEMTKDDLGSVFAPSPHYSGLPEMLTLAKEMDLDFPKTIKIFAIEVVNTTTINQKINKKIIGILPRLTRMVIATLDNWNKA